MSLLTVIPQEHVCTTAFVVLQVESGFHSQAGSRRSSRDSPDGSAQPLRSEAPEICLEKYPVVLGVNVTQTHLLSFSAVAVLLNNLPFNWLNFPDCRQCSPPPHPNTPTTYLHPWALQSSGRYNCHRSQCSESDLGPAKYVRIHDFNKFEDRIHVLQGPWP